jgi:serine protease
MKRSFFSELFVFWSFVWCVIMPEKAMLQGRIPGEFIVQVSDNESVTAFISKFAVYRGVQKSPLTYRQIMRQPFNLWLLSADTSALSDAAFSTILRNEKAFSYVGFNRTFQLRNTPNDPDYARQWQYVNPGGNGGIENADLDIDLAWNITTGGLTPSGDTIVIAVIDDGINGSHEDMKDNLWLNHAEIPGNGLDDDGNGFTDDYKGWNIKTVSDDVYSGGGHGTPVAGIVGAKGNNAKGVSGVNWHVRLMIVNYGSATEANALAAYGYVYSMRKLYNESDGKKGAYVVASNASWGIDKAFPEEAPFWCALYDSLGQIGVLNCGATTNSNTDVDVQGDLPTSCNSEFLLAVTNIGRADSKVINAGYGRKSIDLAAYGQQVFTVTRSSYGNFNGTSGATPHVTGVIGLLYAAPCNALDSIAKSNPALAARIVRDMILHGTLPLSDLKGITTTGGKLNAHRALQNIESLCAPCAPPAGIAMDALEKGIQISWATHTKSAAVSVRYRRENEPSWTTVDKIESGHLISGLEYCTTYEVQLGSTCGWLPGDFSYSSFVTTAGCCPLPVFSNIISGDGFIRIDRLENAASDILLQFDTGTSGWQDTLITGLSFALQGLPECTTYAFRARSNCYPFDNESAFTEPLYVSTPCGTCSLLEYCSFGVKDNSQEWISAVKISDKIFKSGSENKGYNHFSGAGGFTLQAGTKQPFSIEAGYKGTAFPEFFKLYLDLNQDGVFSSGELMFENTAPIASLVSDTLYIPNDAIPGYARMRIIMSYDNFAGSCDDESFEYGEVEDYCVTIEENACVQDAQIKIVAVDTSSVEFSIAWRENKPDTVLLHLRPFGTTDWLTITAYDTIVVNSLKGCTTYEYYIQSVCGDLVSVPSGTDTIKTACFSNVSIPLPEELYVSPNPAGSLLNIEMPALWRENASFSVTDIHGITVPLLHRMTESGCQMDVSRLTPGMYIFTCYQQGVPVSKAKFVRIE